MIIKDEDLNRIVGKGDDLERVIHDLIRAEAWVCGITPDQIDWDYRTNVSDGGRDVQVRMGSQRTDRQFIPPEKSVWSMKSGKDGLEAGTLRREIDDHPKVIRHLQEGGAYVWCVAPAANNDKRDRLRDAAADLATKHGFEAQQIHFFFRDTITHWLNQHHGLIAVHFPHLPRGWKTLAEWKRLDRNRDVAWVEFGDRAGLVEEIRRHLLATSSANVLHLAGWSGIGKTRTTRQACEDFALEGVLYFPTPDAFDPDFEDHLTRNEGIRAAIVIDEMEIGALASLETRLSDFRDRLRVVTIGVGTSKSVMFREGVKWISLPDSATDVTRVILSSDSSLSAEHAQNMADWCDHDLRLALLLTEANKRDPGLAKQPITSVDDVWTRVTAIFRPEIGDVDNFRDLYEILSLCLDIGNISEKRRELEHLATYFGKSAPELDQVIAQACDIGLGRQQGRFFEAAPRALARRVFERWGCGRIRNNALQFFSSLPTERLQRRFIERIQECDQHTRDEAATVLDDWLHARFPTTDITLISDREASRVFAEYVETYPPGGLRWLKQAVEQASPEQLLAFDGKSVFGGGWRGRRQVVWLCQHLAQFPEYFWDCEEILFRLGQYETEENVANNSLRVWQDLFKPLLSSTPLPFDVRWQLLMKRLAETTDRQLPLIITAAMKALNESVDDFVTGSGLPEKVGGKPAPPMWRPASDGELYKMASAAAAQLIEMVKGMPSERYKFSKAAIIRNVSAFIKLGLLEMCREWLAPQNMTGEEMRRLRLSLDYHINHLNQQANDDPEWGIRRQDYEKEWANRGLEYVLPWRRSLDPQSLNERIIDVTGRRSWEQMRDRLVDPLNVSDVYEELAVETLKAPEELSGLWDWFDSGSSPSDIEFGRALGKLDLDSLVEKDLLAQLTQGRCVNLVAGYFYGLYWRRGEVSAPLTATLDDIADANPEAAIFVTLHADISESGFRRLLRLTPQARPGAYSLLEGLRVGQVWPRLMSVERQVQVMLLLREVGQTGQPQAYDLALEMACQWTPVSVKFSAALADALIPMLANSLVQARLPTGGWYWKLAVGKLPDPHLSHKIDLLIEAVKEHIGLRSDALSMLGEILRSHPTEATNILEVKILSIDHEDRRLLGDLLSLFNIDQIETVQRLVRKLGLIGARALAEHISAPYPTAEDPIHVPPMTAWLLDEFAEDDGVFGLFCAARHSNQIYVGGWERYFIGTEEKVAPYLKHPLRRIREWAQNEIDHAKFMIEWDRQLESERDRT
ncbi:MAG: hypothetical protein MOB07_22730 [Acidobacteria bacterium]|nr:hypothetical protein [Acidobacteriota bacterium]